MVTTRKRSSSALNISKSAIDLATSKLQALPEKPRETWSLREAVSTMQASISITLDKGYSYEEIAKILSQKGVPISASSLKSYLSSAKREQGGPIAARKTSRSSKSAQTEQAAVLEAAAALESAEPAPKTEKTGKRSVRTSRTAKSAPAQPEFASASETDLIRRPRRTRSAAPVTSTAKSAAKAKPSATRQTTSRSAAKPASRRRKQK